jgi:hypothetical protein
VDREAKAMRGRPPGKTPRPLARAVDAASEAERRLGFIAEEIKDRRTNQTDDQRSWLDLAEGGLLIARESLTQAIVKERLAFAQVGSIEYFLSRAAENVAALRMKPEVESE